jgi:hypothetical protein
MEYEPKTYFKEQEEDDVKGFTILAASDDKYHVGEKWLKQEDGDSVWMSYWIPEAQLLRRVSDGACTPKGKLSDEQFDQVCGLVGWEYNEDVEKATA